MSRPRPRARTLLAVAATLALTAPASAGAVSYSARLVAPGGNSDAWINEAGDVATAGRGLFMHDGRTAQPPANTHLVGVRADGAAFYQDLATNTYGWLLPDGGTQGVVLPPFPLGDPACCYYYEATAVAGSGVVAGRTYWGKSNTRDLNAWSMPLQGAPFIEYTRPRRDPPSQTLEVLGVTDDARVAISETFAEPTGVGTSRGLLDGTPTGACATVAASDGGAFVQEIPPCKETPHVTFTPGPTIEGQDLGLSWARPYAVSSRGQVVGQLAGNANPVDHLGYGLLWSGGVTQRLDSLLPEGATLRFIHAFDVNERGQILAQGAAGIYIISTRLTMTGTLVDGAGQPVAGATVRVDDVTGGAEPRAVKAAAAAAGVTTAKTDAKGRFTVDVAPGSYRVDLGKGCAGTTVGASCAHAVAVEVGLTDPKPVRARVDARGPAAALPGAVGQRLAPRAGKVSVGVRCRKVTGPCRGTATIRAGGKLLAQGKVDVKPAKTATVRLTLTPAGLALHSATSATLTALGASRRVVVGPNAG